MSKSEKEPLLDESTLEERLVQRVLSKISASDLPKAGESSSVPPKREVSTVRLNGPNGQ